MRNETTQVTIPMPCHENWQQMTPETKGRHCAACAKTVMDFTIMTDNEILAFLNKSKEKICGRFEESQLQRPIIATQLQPTRNWRYWLASLATLFLFTNQSSAQRVLPDTMEVKATPHTILLGKLVAGTAKSDSSGVKKHIVEGVVLDTAGNPLEGGTVIIEGTKRGVTTGKLGKFSLAIDSLPEKFIIKVYYIGYIPQTVPVNMAANKPLTVIMHQNLTTLMGDVVFVKTKRKTNKVKPTLSSFFEAKAFTLFPNPINKNDLLHVTIHTAGNYMVELLDNQSMVHFSSRYTIAVANEAMDITVPTNIVAGLYYIKLVNLTTKKQWTEKLVIR